MNFVLKVFQQEEKYVVKISNFYLEFLLSLSGIFQSFQTETKQYRNVYSFSGLNNFAPSTAVVGKSRLKAKAKILIQLQSMQAKGTIHK